MPTGASPRARRAATVFAALTLALLGPAAFAAGSDAFLLAGAPGARALRQAIERGGGEVRRVLPGGCIVAAVDDALADSLVAAGLARRIERGRFDASSLPEEARLGAEAFGIAPASRELAAAASSGAGPEENDGVPPRAAASGAIVAAGGVARPGSPYLAGEVAVAVVFLESDGSSDPDLESWTERDRASALAEIEAGLDWLAREAATIENGRVVWTYDLALAATPFEAVLDQSRGALTSPDAAALGAMASLGFAATHDGAAAYARSVRARLGTDSVALVCVAPTARTVAAGGPGIRAYAYIGGPFCVMGWPGYLGRSLTLTAPHEVSHLFGAADEYGSLATPGEQRGYLGVANANYHGPNGDGADDQICTMRDLSPVVCPFSIGQVGLLLPGAAADGTPDALQFDAGGASRRDQISVARALAFDDGRQGSSGNANFRPEPGERVALALDLANEAYVGLRAVQATIAVAAGPARVVKAQAAFGDVPALSTRRNSDDLFLVDLDAGAAPGAAISLALEIRSAEGWTLRAPASFAVSQDPRGGAPFALEMEAPLGTAITNAAKLDVAGRTNDPRLTSVTIGGAPALVGAGAFRATIGLPSGSSSISVQATVGATGEWAGAMVGTLRVTTPPAVALDAPKDGDLLPGPTARVSGTVDEPAIASVRVAGIAVPVANGRFAATVPLAAGPNVLEAVAVDAAGSEGRARVSVTAAEGSPLTYAAAPARAGGGGGGCQAGPAPEADGGLLFAALALACIVTARALDFWTRPGGRLQGRVRR